MRWMYVEAAISELVGIGTWNLLIDDPKKRLSGFRNGSDIEGAVIFVRAHRAHTCLQMHKRQIISIPGIRSMIRKKKGTNAWLNGEVFFHNKKERSLFWI